MEVSVCALLLPFCNLEEMVASHFRELVPELEWGLCFPSPHPAGRLAPAWSLVVSGGEKRRSGVEMDGTRIPLSPKTRTWLLAPLFKTLQILLLRHSPVA